VYVGTSNVSNENKNRELAVTNSEELVVVYQMRTKTENYLRSQIRNNYNSQKHVLDVGFTSHHNSAITRALVSQIAAMIVQKGVVIEAESGDLSCQGYCVLSLILWS
jgi:hypothetical protein